MRAFETNDGRFNFVCGGKEVDTVVTGGSREGFIKTFQKISGRTDIEFGELIWLSVFTYVLQKSCRRLTHFIP